MMISLIAAMFLSPLAQASLPPQTDLVREFTTKFVSVSLRPEAQESDFRRVLREAARFGISKNDILVSAIDMGYVTSQQVRAIQLASDDSDPSRKGMSMTRKCLIAVAGSVACFWVWVLL